MDFLPWEQRLGKFDLVKLFKNGFSTGHGHLREPNDIMSYTVFSGYCNQSNQNDQHGGQKYSAFDFYGSRLLKLLGNNLSNIFMISLM